MSNDLPRRVSALERDVGSIKADLRIASSEREQARKEREAAHAERAELARDLATILRQNDNMITLLQERYDPSTKQTEKNTRAIFDPPGGLAIVTPSLRAEIKDLKASITAAAAREAELTREKIGFWGKIITAVFTLLGIVVPVVLNHLFGG